MKPFGELTPRGKLRRMRVLAANALQAYDLDVCRLRLLTVATNTMYRVDTVGGKKYVLRIYVNEETTYTDNQAEIFWLNALSRDTDLRVTEPVPRKDGNFITFATAPGIPGERRCALFRWVPGRELVNYLSDKNYRQLGRAMAMLHNHAMVPPGHPDLSLKKWDRVFYFPNEPVVYRDPAYQKFFPEPFIAAMDAAVNRLDPLLAGLYAGDQKPIWIHADLHFWNVHVYRGNLYLLDFGDILSGFPVQDIAITFYYTRKHEDRVSLEKAFREGYEEIRPWPVDDRRLIRDLSAARMVNFMNYVVLIDPNPQNFIDARFIELREYLANN